MIEVSEYQKSDFDHLIALHESQSSQLATMLTPENLPKIGYIAYDSATVGAMGFLRMLEGGYAMIDTMVSNGDLSAEMRHLMLQQLVAKLVSKGKEMGLKGLISLTSDAGVISRAEAIGFTVINQTAIALSL